MNTCEHSTTIVIVGIDGMSFERCTWGCGEVLVSFEKPDGITVEFTTADILRLLSVEDAANEAMDFLMKDAQAADNAHQKQEAAFSEWVRTRKGRKPFPAVALPAAAAMMRRAANKLAAALEKK